MRRLTTLTVGLALTMMVSPALGQGTPSDEAAIRKITDVRFLKPDIAITNGTFE
jgi:hypothetical protein